MDKDWALKFVKLYDSGAKPEDYNRELGLSFDELCAVALKIQEYRNIAYGIGYDIVCSSEENDFAKKFVALIDKGAQLRAYKTIGIYSREAFTTHLNKLQEYRERAAGKYVKPSLTFYIHSPKFEYICGTEPNNTSAKCSVIVIGTSLVGRLENLLNVLQHIDKSITDAFGDKILSIDDFGDGVPASIVQYGMSNNWVIIAAKRRGMVKSQRDALSLVKTPWVLYSEDDAIVEKLPSLADMELIDNTEHGGRKCGVLSMMAGGYNIEAYKSLIEQEIRKETSYLKINNEDVMWIRNDNFRNHWFIEFPVSFMRTSIMKDCSDYITSTNIARQIEHGFTVAWFDSGKNVSFFKATYMKNPAGVKKLLEYSSGDITNIFINWPLIHMRLLSSSTIAGGHNFGDKFNA